MEIIFIDLLVPLCLLKLLLTVFNLELKFIELKYQSPLQFSVS